MLACNYVKRMEQMLEFICSCTHVLVHVHILTNEWTQERGDWNMYTGQYMDANVLTQPCKWGGADVKSWADMDTYTDACTHPNKGVEPEDQ